jgi:ribose-phosphate pyrophosphokinase
MHNNVPRIFTGNANPGLAQKICAQLDVSLGHALVTAFSDGEIRVEIGENVRGRDVFLIQPTCPPTNHNLMELLIMIDAVKRASARRITAVIPYFGYARQDRKVAPRVPITAKLVADLITTAGADRILTMDLHAGQLQGFLSPRMPAACPGPEPTPSVWGPPWASSTKGGMRRARLRP